MKRVSEKDLMESKEQASAYANADFTDANNIFIDKFLSCSKITKMTKILDIGCGDGEIPISIYGKYKCKITALDGSESMLEEFTKKLSKSQVNAIDVIHQRYENHTLEKKSFDIVMSNSVLHHVASPKSFWKSIINLTKDGGRVCVMDLVRPSNECNLSNILKKYGGTDPVLLNDFENSLRAAYTIDEVINQLSSITNITSSVKLISDRHFFVTIDLK